MNEPKSVIYYEAIISLIDNMERAADCGASIGHEARNLVRLIELYGLHKGIEMRISAGFPPLEDEDVR